jgi:hypothetical protein
MAGTEAKGIRAAIGEMIDAQDADDAGRLRSLLSERPDAVDIGTDVGEWRISGELLDAVAVGGDGDIQMIADDVRIQGDVAWTEGGDGSPSQSGCARPVRMTGVLIREHGRWTMAQSHASIAVPNAGIFS